MIKWSAESEILITSHTRERNKHNERTITELGTCEFSGKGRVWLDKSVVWLCWEWRFLRQKLHSFREKLFSRVVMTEHSCMVETFGSCTRRMLCNQTAREKPCKGRWTWDIQWALNLLVWSAMLRKVLKVLDRAKKASGLTCMVLHLKFGGATIENVSISGLDSAASCKAIYSVRVVVSILSNWSRTSSNNAPHLNMFTSSTVSMRSNFAPAEQEGVNTEFYFHCRIAVFDFRWPKWNSHVVTDKTRTSIFVTPVELLWTRVSQWTKSDENIFLLHHIILCPWIVDQHQSIAKHKATCHAVPIQITALLPDDCLVQGFGFGASLCAALIF